jgi:hypothetical protein
MPTEFQKVMQGLRSLPGRAVRPVLPALLLATLAGCATLPGLGPAPKAEEASEAPAPKPARRAAPPAPQTPSPPARPTERSAPRPAPAAEPEARPAPAPMPAPVAIPGPAWLKKCLAVQVAGGIVRCDTDLLLAKPSPTVQVFTRDPKRVVPGQITLRERLPHVYRLYVVP